MCNHCSTDPRDKIYAAERALLGLRLLLAQLPASADVQAEPLSALVGLVHDQLEVAALQIEGYAPRDPDPRFV